MSDIAGGALRHAMETEVALGHGWMVQCPSCPRRLFFLREGGIDVIDQGTFEALHSWSSSPDLVIRAEVGS